MTASLPKIADKDAPFTFLDCGCVVYCYTENGVQSVDIQQCGLHESAPKIAAAMVEIAGIGLHETVSLVKLTRDYERCIRVAADALRAIESAQA